MTRLPQRSAIFSCALLLACSPLPTLSPNVCGNGVIDGQESCDGFDRGEAQCRPPGATNACQLDCGVRDDATRPACPQGWGCDAESICRAATGNYRVSVERIPGNAFSLLAADFDGDGRDDVVSQQPMGLLGVTTFRVHYFDRAGKLEQTWASPASVASLQIASITQDGRADVAFTNGRLGMLLGQADRTLISETYASYFLADTKARLFGPLFNDDIANTAPLVVLAERAGEITMQHPDASTGILESVASFPATLEQLAGEPVGGRVFEDAVRFPCTDMAFALRGDSAASLYSVCERETPTSAPQWRKQALLTRVQLEPAAPIDRGPLLADVDGDGHTDLLIGAEGRAYVAFGDGQQLTAAQPLFGTLDQGAAEKLDQGAAENLPMPLAAGDFNGDQRADFVLPSGLLLSQPSADRSGLAYQARGGRLGSNWSEAYIADLNGNGFADVIAASSSSLDLDFLNGTGTDRLNSFVLQTKRPVQQLALGDFDGDLIFDVALRQLGSAGEPDEVAIAFGNSSGAPTVNQAIARVSHLQQVGSLPYSGTDSLGELFLVFDQTDASGVMGTAVSWFSGSGDRNLRCSVELTTFSADGSIESVPGLVLSAGAFTHHDQLDLLLFGSDLTPERHGFWLSSDLRSGSARPESLGYGLDPQLVPLRGGSWDETRVPLQLQAADLDADGLDELVLAAPDESDEHCSVAIARVQTDPSDALVHHLAMNEPLQLDQACAQPGQLGLADLDRDGATDIALLTVAGTGARTLRILWNDGQGGFSLERTSTLDAGESVAAFTPLRAASAFAYVTPSSVRLVDVNPARELSERRLELPLERATGIVAADLDGDGIQDLVVADSGDLRVLHSELER